MPLLDSKSIPPELLAIYEQEEHWGEEPEKEDTYKSIVLLVQFMLWSIKSLHTALFFSDFFRLHVNV